MLPVQNFQNSQIRVLILPSWALIFSQTFSQIFEVQNGLPLYKFSRNMTQNGWLSQIDDDSMNELIDYLAGGLPSYFKKIVQNYLIDSQSRHCVWRINLRCAFIKVNRTKCCQPGNLAGTQPDRASGLVLRQKFKFFG